MICGSAVVLASADAVCESDLRRCNYIGVCTGRACVSDLCRRSYISVCRGGICVAAVLLVFAEEVSV